MSVSILDSSIDAQIDSLRANLSEKWRGRFDEMITRATKHGKLYYVVQAVEFAILLKYDDEDFSDLFLELSQHC